MYHDFHKTTRERAITVLSAELRVTYGSKVQSTDVRAVLDSDGDVNVSAAWDV